MTYEHGNNQIGLTGQERATIRVLIKTMLKRSEDPGLLDHDGVGERRRVYQSILDKFNAFEQRLLIADQLNSLSKK